MYVALLCIAYTNEMESPPPPPSPNPAPNRAGTSDSDLQGDLFVPLVVYFFVTLAAVLGGGAYLAGQRWRASGGGAWCSRVGRAVPEGGGMVGGGEVVAAEGGVREAWQIHFKELRFERRIGVGNMGEVYRGTFRGRTVAIKKLLGSWYKDDDMVDRFRDEILLMSTMNHSNVLQFVGAVLEREAGNICLVTEVCERGTLYDLLHSREPLSWQRRLKMARDIALGMDYLHTKARIIQRDLKSQNLLVTHDYEVKIADFGLSRTIVPGRMLTYCGTPATMAPEIVRQEQYNERADVFSYGIILWELLTREEPYPSCSGLGLAYAVATRGMRPPIPAYCPAEWAALMTACWSDDATRRPSFDEVQRLLAHMTRTYDTALTTASRAAAAAAATAVLAGYGRHAPLPSVAAWAARRAAAAAPPSATLHSLGPEAAAADGADGRRPSASRLGTDGLPISSGTGGKPAPWVNAANVVIVGRGAALPVAASSAALTAASSGAAPGAAQASRASVFSAPSTAAMRGPLLSADAGHGGGGGGGVGLDSRSGSSASEAAAGVGLVGVSPLQQEGGPAAPVPHRPLGTAVAPRAPPRVLAGALVTAPATLPESRSETALVMSTPPPLPIAAVTPPPVALHGAAAALSSSGGSSGGSSGRRGSFRAVVPAAATTATAAAGAAVPTRDAGSFCLLPLPPLDTTAPDAVAVDMPPASPPPPAP